MTLAIKSLDLFELICDYPYLIRPYIFHSTIVSDTDVNWPKAIISLFLNNYLKCSHKTSKHALNVKQNYSKTFLNISFHF